MEKDKGKICIEWCIDDVLMMAKNKGINITRKQASEVLELALRRHDASIGVNWDVLSAHLDEVLNG